MSELEDIDYILRKVDSNVLDIFVKIKEKLDARNWLEPLIKKYSEEEKIPWIERRKLLFREIIREISMGPSEVLKEVLINLFAEWIYAKKLLLGYLKISEKELEIYLDALKELHKKGFYPEDFVIWNPTHGALKRDMIRSFITSRKDEEAYIKAMDIGFYLNKILRNISPLILLILLLPSIDRKNKNLYISEGEVALKMFMIKDYWYSFIEKRALPDIEHWDFWINFINELKEENH